eukprot:CAMPEP_0204347800 /NCGR_PEP_ID=MMETSP0469-20131031/28241_1 /ASSEMBLY_ACC=CAM_ASM_000384 /TAXON_ID=2969 /ORGANISM="Oxyrrhis marina" /LENGTH=40 /DNA_ID= /DNA_START= /DNA_END= /DNA_ORIENTATION=
MQDFSGSGRLSRHMATVPGTVSASGRGGTAAGYPDSVYGG